MNPFSNKKIFLNNLKKMSDVGTVKCPVCEKQVEKDVLAENMYVCPECGHYFTVSARYRIKTVADPKSFREICGSLKGKNPLNFDGYDKKLAEARQKTNMKEAVIAGTCRINNIKVVICAMDSRFLMGSMGMAVGEKITRAFEYGTRKKLPVIVFATSGGARMQEGILSLFQMAKTSAAVARHSEEGQLFISVMTHPTTGGVTASFASLGDIILAEPKALIGFAGPRVIRQTINQSLPEGFQRAEYLKEHGFIDNIVERQEMRDILSLLLRLHDRRERR